MNMWVPRFACPACSLPLDGTESFSCACGATYTKRDGIYLFLSEEQRAKTRAFGAQYRQIRGLDGHHAVLNDHWSSLPDVPPTQPAATEWRVRRESWQRFRTRVLRQPQRRILDLGTGSGWLASRCACMHHFVVAVDRFDDHADVQAMRRHTGPPFVIVQADFETLPLMPGQFDVAVFNASLHYAADPERTLAAAAPLLVPGGVLVVMDSPMFKVPADGEAMVRAQLGALSHTCGGVEVIRPGAGYLTFADLDAAARRLGRRPLFVPSRGPLTWRLRRGLAPWRLGRAPAAFGMWVAR